MIRTRSGASKPHVMPQDVMVLLGKEYGTFEWEPRRSPVFELVYTILSQHTSDVNSERAFVDLIDAFGTPDLIANADVKDIEKAIRSGGLSRVKAPRVKALLNQILKEVGSYDLTFLRDLPLDEAKSWLKRFNGIGPKTAAVILCFALGMPAMPVDTHVFRVARRLGFIGPKITANQAHDILESMVPVHNVYAFHMYLINHGRRVCKARRPKCDQCVLAWGCLSRPLFQSAVQSGRSSRAI